MGEIKEKLSEKSVSFWARTVLRLMAWVVLMFYMVFRILIPVMNNERVELDPTDGYIIMACIGLLLAVEAVKLAWEKWIAKKIS
jgi:threonine/homoserine/homoserine lactone efflux protein